MPIWPFQVSGPAQGEVPPFVPQPSSTRQVSSTGLSRRCCLRASPDRPTRLRLAVPKWTRRQGEETPLGPSSGEETPISQDGMSYRVRSLPSSLFHPSNRALPSDCVARVEKLCPPSRANPRKPRASDAEEALAQIWDDLPDAVRTAVKDAGWTPDSPPGLGFSQIRGDSSDHSQTAAAELYKQADEETKKLLKMAGVSEPEGPPPTALQAVHQANKAYQKHTADLRQLVLRRVTLQSKCDKAKLAYEAMCREVKTLSDDIAAKETEVAKAHLLIKTKAAVPAPPPLLRMSEVLKKAGVELTDDQIKSIEEQIQEPVVEAPTDLNPVGPRTLGLVLDATEMDVDEVEVLQKKLDEVRDRAKRKREVSPPPSQAHFLPSDPGAHPSGPTTQTHMPPNPPLVLGPKEPPKDKSQNDAAGL